ncbi:hypothetical protein BDV23DRAFT_152967 [Aspergillus alliaceus]|uniref:Uncharacterized protein n=1 Tax=Petromyces alliaceus TaxID=209559 RepID=A0A5N7CBP0_PETAA|nr:hypothetical protein BDV23DRAFT_152967 [Aspergillus alliaceus]
MVCQFYLPARDQTCFRHCTDHASAILQTSRSPIYTSPRRYFVAFLVNLAATTVTTVLAKVTKNIPPTTES